MANNLYFNPEPYLYLLGLKILGVIGCFVGIFALYIILFQSPKRGTKFFKILIIYHVIIGVLFQLTITFLAPPRIYLPYIALDFPGIYSILGISPEIQLALLLSSIVAAASITVPLFYYRMDNIIPKDHFLNKIFIRVIFYLSVYLGLPLVPIVLIVMSVQDQTATKEYLISKFQIEYSGFESKDIIAFRFDLSNAWVLALGIIFIIGTIIANSLVIVCSVIIYRTFIKKTEGALSTQTSKLKKSLRMSLLASILVIVVIIAFIIPTAGFLLMTNSYRADIMNITIFLGACAFPFAILTFYITYAPYRRIMIRLLWRRKRTIQKGRETSVIFMTTRPNSSFFDKSRTYK